MEEYGTTVLYMIAGMLTLALVFAFYQPGGAVNDIIRSFMSGLTG